MLKYYAEEIHISMPEWRRVRIPPTLRLVWGDEKGTQCPGV
jgi:hypothetical protein